MPDRFIPCLYLDPSIVPSSQQPLTVKYKGITPDGNLGIYVEIVGKALIISADYTRTVIQGPRTWELVLLLI